MSGRRQISPTESAACFWPAVFAPEVTEPVVFGAAALGSAPGGRPLGHTVGRAGGNRPCDAGPGFAAAEKAQHAALDFKLVGPDGLDGRTVGLAVLGVIKLGLPIDRPPGFFFMSIRIGMPSVGLLRFEASGLWCHARRAFFPRPRRPTCLRCIRRLGCWRRRPRPSSRRLDPPPKRAQDLSLKIILNILIWS